MRKRKIIILSLLFSILFSTFGIKVSANTPYHSYTYDYWEDPVYIPDPYLPESTMTGQTMGSGHLSNPQDLVVAPNGHVYIADTGNNRIVVLNSNYQYITSIEEFSAQGQQQTFSAPSGVFVTEHNEVYIADTSNNRIVVLDENYEFIKYVQNPESEILEDGFVFTPLKVAVDYADRVYVIANNVYQGIMTFDEFGDFNGFSGTINVSLSFSQKVWRLLSTREQRARQILYIPTEFTGLDVDPDGFIYASNIDTEGEQAVRRLNPKGQDVIKKSARNNIGGDLDYHLNGTHSGPSTIVDVAYRGNGMYSALDSKRGRIFNYDDEGNLLYIFGGLGTQAGTFNRPVAIEEKDGRLLVLDAGTNSLTSFTPTYYGSLINQAVTNRYIGNEIESVELWEEVLRLDTHNELAYIGIGKSYLAEGRNDEAVTYLKHGKDREYYSIAYKRYRNDVMHEHFNLIITSIILIIILFGLYRYFRKNHGFRFKNLFTNKKIKTIKVERSEVNV